MKKLSLITLLLAVAAIKPASAQTTGNFKLSAQYPAAGEKVSFIYDAAGTPLDGKPNPEGVIYFLDGKENPAIDITLKPTGKVFTGSFTIPASAKFFFVKLSQDTSTDNNKGQGYISYIYKNQQPVAGAFASRGFMLVSGLGAAYGKIKNDDPLALSLYKQDFAAHPEIKPDYQYFYALYLSSSKDAATKALVYQQILELAQGGDEKNMVNAAYLYTRLKLTKSADSVNVAINAKFPDHKIKNDMGLAFSKEKDPVKKEELYKAYIAKFPEDAAEKRSVQDNYRVQLAAAYLQAGKYDDYARVAATVKRQDNLVYNLNNTAYGISQKGGNLDSAALLSKRSIDIVKAAMVKPEPSPYQSPKSLEKSYKSMLDSYGDTYAGILLKQGKFKEAYAYEKPIYADKKGESAEINENYALILNAMGKYKEAMQVIEDAIKAGKSTTPMIGALKDAYVKVKGNENGFEAYYSPMREFYIKKLKGDLLKEMINTPAPKFALKDFDGNVVSLADLKGKVVIVDFWATWCGPCKASFPGMQLAVTKFKDDPSVKFLFIDTWETVENYTTEAQKFIADNKYTFKVLEDEKAADGKHGKVVADFGVEGIPTKFVIDANGNIRFKHIGFDGSKEALVDEVATMIDIAAHPTSAALPNTEKANGSK